MIGNVGALGQRSLKRLLGYSGIAQAGYILGGLVVANEAGVNALVFYLAAYAFMNLAAFAVIVARERETPYRRRPRARCEGSARERPLLAWPLTISMLGLAGLPATVGFIGKLYLIEALVEGDYTWLAVFIAVGTMISLAYYLRVVAAMWMRPASAETAPAIAGASPEADPIDPRGRSPPLPRRTRSARRRGGRLLRHRPSAAGGVRRTRRVVSLLSTWRPGARSAVWSANGGSGRRRCQRRRCARRSRPPRRSGLSSRTAAEGLRLRGDLARSTRRRCASGQRGSRSSGSSGATRLGSCWSTGRLFT